MQWRRLWWWASVHLACVRGACQPNRDLHAHVCASYLSHVQVDLARTFTGYDLDLCLCDVDTVWINGES